MLNAELGLAATLAVSLGAGFIRGFTGFGGPAFMLAILTWFYTPLAIVSKILIIELIASTYLFASVRHEINWRSTLALAIPTILTLPLGQWLLLEIDPHVMRRIIAAVILVATILMLLGFRYHKPLGTFGMIAVGLAAGVIFGASYIALLVVAAILSGPYNKADSRALLVSWALLTAIAYAIFTVINKAISIEDVYVALPGAAAYLAGTWLGAQLFHRTGERGYRRFALITLLVLSILSILD